MLWSEEYTDEQIGVLLNEAQRLGARYVQVPIFNCQMDSEASVVGACQIGSEGFSLRVARMAKARGFSVAFLPIVATPSWEWRGNFNPANSDRWFATYGEWILKIARLSRDFDLSEVIVGSEFGAIYDYEAHWRALISRVREVFSGPLVLTVNWKNLNLGYWDAVDAIGVSAYFPLSRANKPKQEDLNANWVRIKDKLVDLSIKWNRPLHLTEVGYPSGRRGANNPAGDFKNQSPDWNIQRMAFEAFDKAWRKEPRLARVAFWALGDASRDVYFNIDHNFTFGKPAADVVASFLKAQNGL